ncbi:MAG: hypothetical protein H6R02_978, partial [Burkholderiaceae bacterium]|nr:hypothetical protein [Burkholderiaceae bacterium]
ALDSATVGWPKDIVLAKVPEMLAAQFPKDTKLEQVRGACPDERLSGSRIYRATLAGRKPLYLHVRSRWSLSATRAGFVERRTAATAVRRLAPATEEVGNEENR